MRHSLETAAQVTTVIEVDMTGVVNLRKKWKPIYAERHGVNLTYVPFVARATMDAIGRWPWVNAEIRGESALIKRYVNLGMAVAIDDSKGLMVPVIHHAEELNLVGLSRAVIDLADKARTKTLTPDEMSGGTFTITNPGVFGALIGTPIIPEGQVAILDVEAIVKRPVVVTDRHGNDAIAIRHMMFLCLSYDHRLVDGAYAAQFMAQLKQNLRAGARTHTAYDVGEPMVPPRAPSFGFVLGSLSRSGEHAVSPEHEHPPQPMTRGSMHLRGDRG